jgi:hypothetical protein
MSQSTQIEKLLTEVTGTLADITRIEQECKESKNRTKESLRTTIHQLAVLADSQAVRAQILRELYWKNRMSAEIIGDAFGLEMRRIAGLAGAYTIEYPCRNECGGSAEVTFTSRAELERHESSYAKPICAACEKQKREESERKSAEQARASARRVAELRAMSWQEFTDTPEWIWVRGRVLVEKGFSCDICGASGVSLNVCLHKDTPQFPLPSGRLFGSGIDGEWTHFYVLCQDCIKRCEDLLHPEWRERIKAEFLNKIQEEVMSDYA